MADMAGFRMPEPPLHVETSAGDLAQRLVRTVVNQLRELEASTAPGLTLPAIMGGHPVLDDARADLIYVLGLLVECGVETLDTDRANTNETTTTSPADPIHLRGHLQELIGRLTPEKVEGFYSYRVGETAIRLGGLEALPDHLRQHTLDAVDSPEIRQRLTEGGAIPPNFAIVAARCLAAGAKLSGEPAPDFEVFIDRAQAMFDTPNGWIDDGMAPWVHYDIYTPDMYLFADPLTEYLDPAWTDGLRQVLADLDDIAQPGGGVVWGRSIGALGLAITIELASVATGRNLVDAEAQRRWLSRAITTLDQLATWFPNGVIAAHQYRSTMFYRGPARRLQMTLDVMGKLLLAALELQARPEVTAGESADRWREADRLIEFAPGRNIAAVWTFRAPTLRFTLPTVFGFSSDYLPYPRSPGLFEGPTSGHPTMLPVISPAHHEEMAGKSATALAPAGLPETLNHEAGQLSVTHRNWSPIGVDSDADAAVAGSRKATYRVEGRSLIVRERLRFDSPDQLPGPLTISIPETPDRPLAVHAEGAAVTAQQRIDTSGLTEWRSFWGELPVVHQIELTPASEIDMTWRVTPRLRVASTITGHQYDRSLYAPLQERLITLAAGLPDAELAERLDGIDVLHMAWPEWWAGTDPRRNAEVLALLKQTGTRIVWTQHNLLPHYFKDDDAQSTYQLWAEAADAVIHHTRVGMDVAMRQYRYGPQCRHEVIPHGHWGAEYRHLANRDRADVRRELERREGWPAAPLRLGVVGAPRQEKLLQQVVDAVAASTRDDIQLVIRVDDSVTVPDDSRIIADTDHLDGGRYEARVAAVDALILPFAPAGMLTTGTAFDAIGAGVAAITSDWAFFDETFDGADIRYGTTATELTACIDNLDPQQLSASAAAMADRQPHFEWTTIATRTAELFESIADGV